jgi:fatty-acid desaturase
MIKHHKHHKHVHTELDPDYHKGNFLSWYISFYQRVFVLVAACADGPYL